MTLIVVCYLVALVAFAAIDITWLMTVGGQLYKETLGDILAPEIRYGPAVLFYAFYPAGLVYFAVNPALKQGDLSSAFVNGALFGLFTYGTYELTNFATLRNWTTQITVIDIAYGAIASGIVAAIVYLVAPAIARSVGG
jgi:uncharacterized membrane protein